MTAATLVAGVDSSTQSCKVVVCDASTGEVVRSRRAPHPDGTEVDPQAWVAALEEATAGGLLEGVEAVSVAAQQHGLVACGRAGEVVRPALLWNDTRSAAAAEELCAELGGPAAWAAAVGSVPVASFTITKWRWLCDHEPELADRAERLLLPHDWLTLQLSSEHVTDRGDASGTGWWGSNSYRPDLLAQAGRGREPSLPRVLGPAEPAGRTREGVTVGPGTGDNMAAALGVGARPGDVVVSLGTSGTVFAVSDSPTADASGLVAGFADATGRWLPLVCTLNCAQVLDATTALLGSDLAGLDRLALGAPPGAGGLTLLPYLDGERTPNLPGATGSLSGVTRTNFTPEHLARAAVEGVLCGLADGLGALRAVGVPTQRAVLVGGVARSAAVRCVAPSILGLPVTVPAPAEYVALGAARQAAWALVGGAEPPAWPPPPGGVDLAPPEPWGDEVRAAYSSTRERFWPRSFVPSNEHAQPEE